MNLSFTIPYPFIGFMCHAVALICCIFAGTELPVNKNVTAKYLILCSIAGILTTIGAIL